MKKLILFFIVFVSFLLSVTSQTVQTGDPKTAGSAVVEEKIELLSNPELLLAKMGEHSIFFKDIEKQYKNQISRMAKEKYTLNKITHNFLVQNIVSQKIEDELMFEAATKSLVKVEEQEVQDTVNKIKSRFQGDEKFASLLSSQGLTVGDFENQVRRKLLIQEFKNSILFKDIDTTDKTLETFYDENKEALYPQESFNISQILLKIGESNAPQVKDDKTKQLLSLRERAKNGESFADLAKQFSQGGAAERGGNLGWIEKITPLDKAILEALITMKKGDISDVIQTNSGLHIIRLNAYQPPPKYKSFKEGKEEIKLIYSQKARSEVAKSYLMARAKEIGIEFFPITPTSTK